MKLFREQLLLFCHREMHKKSSQRKNGILFDRHFSPVQSRALPKSRALPMSHSRGHNLRVWTCCFLSVGRAVTAARYVLKMSTISNQAYL